MKETFLELCKKGKTAYDIAAVNPAINDNPEILALLKG